MPFRKVRTERAVATNRNLTLNEVTKNYISSKISKPMPDIEYKKYLKHCEFGIGKKKISASTDIDIAKFKVKLIDQG